MRARLRDRTKARPRRMGVALRNRSWSGYAAADLTRPARTGRCRPPKIPPTIRPQRLARRGSSSFSLLQVVAVSGPERHAVERLELLDLFQCPLGERRLAFECVQDDSLQQVAEADVLLLGERLEHFQHALFNPDTGLNAL